MAPWLVAVIFVAVLVGTGWLVDFRARRRRRGLTSVRGAVSHEDRIAQVERISGGATQHAMGEGIWDSGQHS
jgi:hypothetical protein